MKPQPIAHLRQDYDAATLDVESVLLDPIAQFERWFLDALDSEVLEPNAMTLATCTAAGRPSARIVLLKGYDPNGFIFFTNYESQKGQELAANPYAALTFWWDSIQRQVRIEGVVEKIPDAASVEYFQSRPKGSQIGAWASPQSRVIEHRELLEKRVAELETQYENSDILPRPLHWGGYLVRPYLVEFWQGRTNRLHDRVRYTISPEGDWKIERLAP